MSHAPDPRSKGQRRADLDRELATRRAAIQRIRADAAERGVSLTYTEIQEVLQETLKEQDNMRAQPKTGSGSRPAASSDPGISRAGLPESSILTTVGCLAWFCVPGWMLESLWMLRNYSHVDEEGAGFMLGWLPLGLVAAIAPWLAGKWVASAADRQRKWFRFLMVLLYVLVAPAVGFLVFAHTIMSGSPGAPRFVPTRQPSAGSTVARPPKSFSYNYQYEPKGPRHWRQVDAQTWLESHPDGSSVRHHVVARGMMDDAPGTVVRRQDGAVEVFIPDIGSRTRSLLFRPTRENNWYLLGEMYRTR